MEPVSSTSGSASAGWFATTHWSVVLSAGNTESQDSAAALEKLCRTYWFPLYCYARRTGQSPADAEDLTQGFFAKLLSKEYLKSAEKDKGRFRTFLLTALKRFMANEWDRNHAQKRGGFAATIPIDQEIAESRFNSEGSHNVPPDVLFDRQWAAALLGHTLERLKQEYENTGRAHLFGLIRGCIAPEESALPYAQIGERLHLSEAAVKMAVFRLRSRYREILQEEIAQTVATPQEVEQEIRDLFAAFV